MGKSIISMDIANKKYKNVLLVSYICVAVIVISVMLLGSFKRFSQYVENVIAEMSQIQIQNLENNLDKNIDLVRVQLRTAKENSAIINYLYADSTDPLSEYAISRFLQKVCSSSGSMESIFLYKLTGEMKYFGQRYFSEEQITYIKQKLQQTTKDSSFFLLDENSLCIYITDRKYLNGEPESGILGVINLKYLTSSLLSDKNINAKFAVIDKEGQVIIGNHIEKNDCAQIIQCIEEQSQESTGFVIQLDDSEYICNYKEFDNQEYCVVMLQNNERNKADMSELKKTMYFYTVISFFAVLVVSIFLTNIIYYPFSRFFHRLNKQIQDVVNDENQTKMRTEITSAKILGNINILSQQYQADRVLRYLENTQDGRIPLELQLSNGEEHCILMLFWGDKRDLDPNVPETVCAKLEQLLGGCKVRSFNDRKNAWFLVQVKEFCRIGKLLEKEKVVSCIKKSNQEVEQQFGITISCLISEVQNAEETLRNTYKGLMACQKYALFDACSSIMFMSAFEDKKKDDIDKRIYEPIIEAMQQGSEEEAIAQMQDVIDKLAEYEIQKALYSLAEMCVLAKQKCGGAELLGKNFQKKYLEYYIRMMSFHSKRELLQYLSLFMKETCMEENVTPEKNLRMIMINAVDYIGIHYRETDMSVEKVAEQVKISASYFSKLFNEYIGMKFPEYINDLRLSCAIEILQEHREISIKKVAEYCGFSTVSYFSAQFKKKYGYSPSAIRN